MPKVKKPIAVFLAVTMDNFKRFYLWQENFLDHLAFLKDPAIFLARIYIAVISLLDIIQAALS
jgi:hypothetical protein